MAFLSIITRLYHMSRMLGMMQDSQQCQCDKCREERRTTCKKNVSHGTNKVVLYMIIGVLGFLLFFMLGVTIFAVSGK